MLVRLGCPWEGDQVKIEETVYELLIKEYEKSRIEETRDTPTVQILDRVQDS